MLQVRAAQYCATEQAGWRNTRLTYQWCHVSHPATGRIFETEPTSTRNTGEIIKKIRQLILAASAAAFLAPAAFAATTASKPDDCMALQQKFDKQVAAHSTTSATTSKAKDMRAQGEKLCKEGKTSEGTRKLHEALQELSGKAY